MTPNPGNRAEDFIFEKIEKKKPTRLSNLEYLGLDMIEVSTLREKFRIGCVHECLDSTFIYSFTPSI